MILDSSKDEGATLDVRPQKDKRPGKGRGNGRGGVCRTPQDDSESDIDERGWSQDPTPPVLPEFTVQPGLQIKMLTTLLGFLHLFITRELPEYLMEETNAYAKYMCDDMQLPTAEPWTPVSLSDMVRFLSVMMVMGFFPAPDMRMYWRHDKVYSVLNLSLLMSHTRFEAILQYFHTFNRKAIPTDNLDWLIIVRPIVAFFRERFPQVYTSECDLSLDEGMMAYKGHFSIKVYNPKKPSKYGIKLYMLCESKTGYVLDHITPHHLRGCVFILESHRV